MVEFGTDYAAAYEAERANKPGWRLEELAVAEFTATGPVLDCPVGTGRFAPIWNERGLDWVGIDRSAAMLGRAVVRWPGARLVRGDALALPFRSASFGAVVCIRLLPWLDGPGMVRAVAEAGRVGGMVVMSVRLGAEGVRCRRGSRNHTLGRFLWAVQAAGLKLTDSRQTAMTEAGQFVVTKLERR